MTAAGKFVTPRDAQQVDQAPGVHRRTMGTTDKVMLCEFFLERDAITPEHSHMNDQIGYLVYGKVEFTIGGETRLCQPGDSWAVPGGVPHGSRALMDSLVIEAFAPPRNDYRTEAE
jgi:quercetin dioxygenase-like cupin family protein